MEQLCKPTRRYQDLLEQDDDDEITHHFECSEVQLDVPVEDFLVYDWDWKDLQTFLTGE
jgi:hypothetical protein